MIHKLELILLTFSLVDVSDIFYFSARGKGRGSPRCREGGGGGGGGRLFVENPRRRGSPGRVGQGGEGPGGCLRGISGGRGPDFFFFSAEIPTKFSSLN